MENYKAKFGFLVTIQNRRCVLKCKNCGGMLSAKHDRLDLDHIMQKSRSGKAAARWEERFREFGDSVLNLRVIPHCCHIGGNAEGTRYTKEEGNIFERILRTEKHGSWTYGDVMNMRSDLTYRDIVSVYDDVMNKFKELTNGSEN